MTNDTQPITEEASRADAQLTFEDLIQLQIQEYIATNRHGPVGSVTYSGQRAVSSSAKGDPQ